MLKILRRLLEKIHRSLEKSLYDETFEDLEEKLSECEYEKRELEADRELLQEHLQKVKRGDR